MSDESPERKIKRAFQRNDCLDREELGKISQVTRGGDPQALDVVKRWLEDLALGDGTNTEAKLAAIILGLLPTEPLAGDGFGPGYRINPGEGGRTGESRP